MTPIETWKCTAHNITLTVEDKRRTFQTPAGSIRGMPPCQLLTLNPLKEGEFLNCHIEKVS